MSLSGRLALYDRWDQNLWAPAVVPMHPKLYMVSTENIKKCQFICNNITLIIIIITDIIIKSIAILPILTLTLCDFWQKIYLFDVF